MTASSSPRSTLAEPHIQRHDSPRSAPARRIDGTVDCSLVFGLIDHVGVAVDDLDAAISLYERSFDMPLAHRETVEEQGVEAVLLDIGDCHVELLRPLGDETAVGKFLAKRGPGLHHVAYRVDDIDATLARLGDAGIELIDRRPRTGIRNSRVAFLHPRSTGGVLTEIVQPAEEH
jgi:methylmalonyl-CoA/ethylmalonyl-CoA epimerase